MILSLFHMLLLFFQLPPASMASSPEDGSLKIWEEIAGLEMLVRKSVNDQALQFSVFNSDPVRGYYVDHMGVYLLVPVRYRFSRSQIKAEGSPLTRPSQVPIGLSEADLSRRIRQWREKLQKEAVTKDAEFESVIGTLAALLPEIAGRLEHLPDEENLTLVIEEREPAWAHVGFRLGNASTRKLVTLRVVKQALSEVHANETRFPAAWMKKIKRTNAKRPVIP